MGTLASLFSLHIHWAIFALMLNAVLMGPRSLFQKVGLDRPSLWVRQSLRDLDRRLNRDNRSLEVRRQRGVIVASIIGVSAVMIGWAGELVLPDLVILAIVAVLLPLRQTLDTVLAIYRAVNNDEIDKARQVLAGSVWRNAAVLDEHGLVRAGLENLATSFGSKVLGPIMWYVLLGLPGLLLSRLMRTLYEQLSLNVTEREGFGWAAAKAEHWLHLIPARAAALLFIAASPFVPFASPRKAWTVLVHEAPVMVDNDRTLLATLGSALGVSLGGPVSAYSVSEWVGGPKAKADAPELMRGICLYGTATLIVLLMLAFFV